MNLNMALVSSLLILFQVPLMLTVTAEEDDGIRPKEKLNASCMSDLGSEQVSELVYRVYRNGENVNVTGIDIKFKQQTDIIDGVERVHRSFILTMWDVTQTEVIYITCFIKNLKAPFNIYKSRDECHPDTGTRKCIDSHPILVVPGKSIRSKAPRLKHPTLTTTAWCLLLTVLLLN